MSGRTPRFGFTTLDSRNDTLALHGYKTFGADREAMDRLLTYAIEKHAHTGEIVSTATPTAPTLEVSNTGGALPPNQAIYYRTSIVNAHGQEEMASLAAVAYTGAQLTTPAPPLLSSSPGTLLPGDYLYAVTAYTGTNESQTIASGTAAGSFAANTETSGGWTVAMPVPPSGATGFNIYRKGPTDYELMHLTAVPADTPAYLDNGIAQPSELRTTPSTNTSAWTSAVEIDRSNPLATGQTCKIYRTFDPTNWENSLLVWTASLPYTDTGTPTRTGYPPAASAGIGGAPKVDLAGETVGNPPPATITPTELVTFNFDGPVTVTTGAWQWVNEYDEARLLAFRAALGRDAVPASQPVIVTLEGRWAGTTEWFRFPDGLVDVTAEIPVNESIGTPTGVASADFFVLESGDALRAVVLQAGGGATPTDFDLTVGATLVVRHGSTTQTYTWET